LPRFEVLKENDDRMTTTRDVVRPGGFVPLDVQTYGRIPNVLDIPDLIKIQLDSFNWFIREPVPGEETKPGLRELLDEISPIQDFTGSKMELRFSDYEFREPKHSQEECRERDNTFAAPLFVDVELTIKESGEIKEQRLFFVPADDQAAPSSPMAPARRRLPAVRSPGVYYTLEQDQTTGATSASPSSFPTAARGSSSKPRTATSSP
jgi:DNA-directed RNA polymerase subunit beta